MSEIPHAARVGDAIEHTNAFLGAITGIAIGLAIGVAIGVAGVLTVATGGAAAIAFAAIGAVAMACTGISAGFTFGQIVGKWSSSKSGVIGQGAKTVFIGRGSPPAARATDKLACGDPPITPGKVLAAALIGPLGMIGLGVYSLVRGDHPDDVIGTGSRTVYIEKLNAARINDETTCTGKIVEGCKTVVIWGPKVDVIPRDKWNPEVSREFEKWVGRIDTVGVVLGLISGVGAVRVIFTQGLRGIIPGIRALSTSQRWDLGLTLGDGVLFTAEKLGGLDPMVRTYYETGTLFRSGWNSRGVLRRGTPDVPTTTTLPRATTPDVPTTVPRATTPDVPTAPRIDAPTPPAPKPVPQGGQTIAERAAQGGNPPPWARQNPDNYYYNPDNSRYMKR